MKVSVIVFPGTNCDHDVIHTFGSLLNHEVTPVWHRDSDLGSPDVVIVPGGFSYGDYLRTGALAKISPIMQSIKAFADAGGPTLGICNGFQILCEAGLLPGALLCNVQRRFLSQFVTVKVESTDTPFTRAYTEGDRFRCPIAHFEGNYFIDPDGLRQLEEHRQIIFRYTNTSGEVDHDDLQSNPNGSLQAIAGICNRERNVVGLMPHPERALEQITADRFGTAGMAMFSGLSL